MNNIKDIKNLIFELKDTYMNYGTITLTDKDCKLLIEYIDELRGDDEY